MNLRENPKVKLRKPDISISNTTPEITLKANLKKLRKNAVSVSLAAGTEIEAWKGDKVIGAMIVDENNKAITFDEHTSTAWVLKKLHVQLDREGTSKFERVIKEYLDKGTDLYELLSRTEIADWLTAEGIEKKLKPASNFKIPGSDVLGKIKGIDKRWHRLHEIPSSFEEVKE